jgi:hypothetical protein
VQEERGDVLPPVETHPLGVAPRPKPDRSHVAVKSASTSCEKFLNSLDRYS